MKLNANKKTLSIVLPLIAVIGIFLLGHNAWAASSWAVSIVSGILGVFIWALGVILILVIKGLILIASYQDFIGSAAVTLGWVIVRDVCNMFFVIVLLIIAFGTILHLENYNYKKWLPKLILMAILINFSKTICGLLIDASQIIMLTFVNAFKDVGGANLTDILGLSKIVTMAKNDSSISLWTVVGAYVLGIIYLMVAVVVIVTMMMMLVMRLVMIWIYVVLSPFAYLLSAFPGGQKYASQWWDEFTKNLIVGPVLAFFIWLSFAALQTYTKNTTADQSTAAEIAKTGDVGVGSSTASVVATEASSPASLIQFVIAIGMLLGGLKISQEIGGMAGSMAGKGMGRIQKGAAFAGGLATGAALLPAKGLKQAAGYGVEKLHEKTGVDLNLKRAFKGVQEKRKELAEKRYTTGQIAAREAMETGGRLHGMLAMTGNSGDAWEQITSWKGVSKRIKGGRLMTRTRESGIESKRLADMEAASHRNELEFMQASPAGRQKSLQETQAKSAAASGIVQTLASNIQKLDQDIATERGRGPQMMNPKKIKTLEDQKKIADEQLADATSSHQKLQSQEQFMTQNVGKTFSQTELDTKELETRRFESASEKAAQKIESNIPDYSFEARAAEQHAVASESSKIKDITDPSELLRIMQDAISAHDKTMVKAIALKMTKEANDNEFLKPLAGRTDHVGLKKLMREFSDKKSANYAGFNQQEAFGLGSQIAEINKNTNHWGATSAYTMEDGKWRETTDKEHNEIRDIETGKQQLQAFIRNNNRLAYGYHENDKDSTFHLDAGGIIKLRSMNNEAGHKNIETMNESAAKYVYDAIKKNPKLEEEFNVKMGKDQKSLISSLESRLGALKDSKSFDEKYSQATNLGTA